LKKAHSALDAGQATEAQTLVVAASRALARAASKGVIHASNAARRTSRLARALYKLSA
jgi:small subunit ribosomal protein S20